MAKRPGGAMIQTADATRSQLIPLVTKWEEIGHKTQLGPIIFCVVTFLALAVFGSTKTITIPISSLRGGYADPRTWIYTSTTLIIVALFLTMVSLYFIYRQVGKNKPWWVLLATLAFSAYFLWLFLVEHQFGWLYTFFHYRLAGGEPDDSQPFLQLFLNYTLGTGFFEELVKGIPVLALAFLTRSMSQGLRAKIAVEEPLDGILIGAAAGGGFALMETLGQYVPRILVHQWLAISFAFHGIQPQGIPQVIAKMTGEQLLQMIQTGSLILNTSPGLSNLILRSLDLSFGHMAYSGYFGYFVGLAVLKPQQRWKILLIGLVSASIPHALWDTIASSGNNTVLGAACALLSYAVLAAAILKAREISPNHAILQPSIIMGAPGSQAGPATPRPAAGMAQSFVPAPAAAVAIHPTPDVSVPGSQIRIGSRFLIIVAGLRLMEHQVPGLTSRMAGGLVAEVTRNPNDPSVLGLTNTSTSDWEVLTGSGVRRTISPGSTAKLAPGTRIDFGLTDGEVC